MTDSHETRLARAHTALEGLSVGDAFGETWFRVPIELYIGLANQRSIQLSGDVWPHTDDTLTSLSLVESLRDHQSINQDTLAISFAKHYHPMRGYGASMHGLFQQILSGVPWRQAASGLFNGTGSYGNGAAMRVAPVGAYFADDLTQVITHAQRSAEVTHAHPEGIAGGIAVAVASALIWQNRENPLAQPELIEAVIPHVPPSTVQDKLKLAVELIQNKASFRDTVLKLGNGSRISAMDTVPFCIWCAGRYVHDYEEAIWTAIGVGGDIDTNCAIIGGMVALHVGVEGIPEAWRKHREPLPAWAF